MFDIFHNADLSTSYDKQTCCLSDSMSTTFIQMNDDKTCLSYVHCDNFGIKTYDDFKRLNDKAIDFIKHYE